MSECETLLRLIANYLQLLSHHSDRVARVGASVVNFSYWKGVFMTYLECDGCRRVYPVDVFWNVDYLDENGNENGFGSVMCSVCVNGLPEGSYEAWQA